MLRLVAAVVSVLVLPGAVAAARWLPGYELLHAGVAVPVALSLGAWVAFTSRAGVPRRVGAFGLALGGAGAIALATYAALALLEV